MVFFCGAGVLFGDCAVPRREDVGSLGGVLVWCFCNISVGIWSRGPALISRRFLEEFLALFLLFLFGICAEPWRTAYFLEEGFWGHFRGLADCDLASGFCLGW